MPIHNLADNRYGLLIYAAVALVAVATGAVHAQEPRLHVIIAADTNDGQIGASVRIDVGWVKQIAEANAPEERMTLTVLDGNRLSSRSLTQSIRDLPVVADRDSVLV